MVVCLANGFHGDGYLGVYWVGFAGGIAVDCPLAEFLVSYAVGIADGGVPSSYAIISLLLGLVLF